MLFTLFIFLILFQFINLIQVFEAVFIQRQEIEFVHLLVEVEVFQGVFKEVNEVFVFGIFDQADDVDARIFTADLREGPDGCGDNIVILFFVFEHLQQDRGGGF